MTTPHGWFEIPGVQTGERNLTERTTPLRPLLKFAPGASVLDLGCAEGLIGLWLMDHGAKSLDGVEKHVPWIETAQRIAKERGHKNAWFYEGDFDHMDLEESIFRADYDIVLCLNVAQKLKEPGEFIRRAAAKSGNIFVYSGPGKVLKDVRSGNRSFDIAKLLGDQWTMTHYNPGMIHKTRGHLGVRMIFRRTALLTPEYRTAVRRSLKARMAKLRKAKRK